MPALRLTAALRTTLMFSGAAGALILGACREEDLARALSMPMTSAAQGYGGYAPYSGYGQIPIGYPNSYDDAYTWAERSYALDRVFYNTAPDYGFNYGGVQPWVWETGNDWSMYADPYGGDDYRYYYYEPNQQRPYFIRDDQYGYGFDNMGRLVSIYDLMGRLMPNSFLSDRSGIAGDYYRRAYDMRRHHQTRPQVFVVDDALWRAREPYIVHDYNDWLRASQYQPWQDYRRRTDAVIVRAFEGEARKRKFHPGFPAHAKGWGPPFLREDGRRVAVASVDDRWNDDGRRWSGNDGRWVFNDRDDRRLDQGSREDRRRWEEEQRNEQRRWEQPRQDNFRRESEQRQRQFAFEQQQRQLEARREADQRRTEARAREEQRRVVEARQDDFSRVREQQRRQIAAEEDRVRRQYEAVRAENERQARGEARRQGEVRQEQARRESEVRRNDEMRQQMEARRNDEQRRQNESRRNAEMRQQMEARRNDEQRRQNEARRGDEMRQQMEARRNEAQRRESDARQEQARRANEQRQQVEAQARENQRRSEETRNRGGRPERQEAQSQERGGGDRDRGQGRERRAESERGGGNGNGNGRGRDRG